VRAESGREGRLTNFLYQSTVSAAPKEDLLQLPGGGAAARGTVVSTLCENRNIYSGIVIVLIFH
jgi:hypothetical protein